VFFLFCGGFGFGLLFTGVGELDWAEVGAGALDDVSFEAEGEGSRS